MRKMEQYRIRDGITPLSEGELNSRFFDLDLRIHTLETLKISWEEAVREVREFGLARINGIVDPLIARGMELLEVLEEGLATHNASWEALAQEVADSIQAMQSAAQVATSDMQAAVDQAVARADAHAASNPAHAAAALSFDNSAAGLAGNPSNVQAALEALAARFTTGENLITNGGYDFWQEGPGPVDLDASGVSNVLVYLPDMWRANIHGNYPRGLIAREGSATGASTVPGRKYFASFVGYLGLTAADDVAAFETPVEDIRAINDPAVTLSFWAMSGDGNHTIHVGLRRVTGVAGASPVVFQPGAQPIDLTPLWNYYRLTFEVPNLDGVEIGPNPDLTWVSFITCAGSSTAATWGQESAWACSAPIALSQVKLERGRYATPFHPRPAGEELRRCQRYFRKSYKPETAPGASTTIGQIRNQHALTTPPGTSNVTMTINLPEPMRAAPTLTLYTTTGVAGKVFCFQTEVTPSITDLSAKGFTISASRSSPQDAYSDVHFQYVLDARL